MSTKRLAKKYRLGFLIAALLICSLIGIRSGSVLAACPQSFDFGFFCSGGDGDAGRTDIRVIDVASNQSINPVNGRTPVLTGKKVRIDGRYNAANTANNEVLVWFTIDGPTSVVEDDATYNNVINNEDNGGNGVVGKCPGEATDGRPGTVFGYRDLSGPEGTTYRTNEANGPNQSPYAYVNDGTETRGVVDCLSSGRMVYYTNASRDNGSYSFDLDFDDGRTSGGNCVNIRMNISLRLAAGEPYFPSPDSSYAPREQDRVAAHIAKQSNKICIDVYNNPPQGTFDVIGCSGYKVNGFDPDHPGDAVFYRVANTATSNISDSGVTSQFDTSFRSKALVSGQSYKAQILDPDLGVWRDIGGQDTASCSSTDTRPTYTLDVYCSGVVVRNIDDGNIQGPPKGQGVHMFAKFWHRYVDGAGTESWAPVNGSMDPNARDYDVDDRSGDIFIAWPWGAEDGQNLGWGMWIGDYNVNLNGDDDVNSAQYKFSAEVEGGCYQATCSIDIGENFTGAPANGVWGGRNFDVTATFYNPDARIPVFVYNFGSWTLAGASSVQNNPLSDDLGGNQLAATDGGGTYDFAPVDFFPGGGSINPGTSGARTFQLTAPSTISSGRVELYPDYYGRMGLGPACGENVNVYNEFKINPTSSLSVDDIENPSVASYSSRVQQDAGLNTGTTIPGSSDRRLYWTRAGVFQGNLDGVLTQSGVRYGDSGEIPGSWTKTGVSPAWQAGDQICSEMVARPHHGWIGPGDDIRADVPSLPANDCEVVVDRPFVRAYGGDVVGGVNGVQGYIRDYQGSAAGSGAEFAAIALGNIRGFSSAMFRNSTPLPASGLAFANTTGVGTGVDQVFGGSFGARTQSNYYNDTRYDPSNDKVDTRAYTAVGVDGLVDGYQTQVAVPAGSKFTLSGSGVAGYTGNKSLFVDGDVVITGDIKYAPWGTTASIPSFALVVKGKIYIDKNVRQLDGLYVAQNGGTNGKIYTCTDGGNLFPATTLHANCASKLQVNGAFVADNVRFLRTQNTLRDIAIDTPKVPPSGGNPSISNVTYSAVGATRPGCLMMVEPSDPNWNTGGGSTTNDNYLCYDRPSDRPTMNLTWSYVGVPAGFAATDCVSFNNGLENVNHTWTDNYMCQPAGANLQLELRANRTVPPGKTCVNITESAWAVAEPGGISPWGNNRMHLCYRTAAPGTPAVNAVYNKEIFGADNATESFYLRPEMYLAKPLLRSEGGQTNSKYDSIVTLPPIL